MNANVKSFASIVLLALAASAWGQPAEFDHAHPEDGKRAATSAPETESVEGQSAGKVAAGSAEIDTPAVGQRRDSPGRGLTTRQKRIFVLGLAQKENQ